MIGLSGTLRGQQIANEREGNTVTPTLPPLPEPDETVGYDASHLEAYALAAIEAYKAQKDLIRFCPECGSLGEVPFSARDCCPDGSHAAHMPRKTAESCARLFRDLLAAAQPASARQQGEAVPPKNKGKYHSCEIPGCIVCLNPERIDDEETS